MNGWFAKIFAGLAASGILAGASGLIVAGGMRADVESMKSRSAEDHAKISIVAEDVAALRATVTEMKTEVAEQRREQRADARELDSKLDRILERLPLSR